MLKENSEDPLETISILRLIESVEKRNYKRRNESADHDTKISLIEDVVLLFWYLEEELSVEFDTLIRRVENKIIQSRNILTQFQEPLLFKILDARNLFLNDQVDQYVLLFDEISSEIEISSVNQPLQTEVLQYFITLHLITHVSHLTLVKGDLASSYTLLKRISSFKLTEFQQLMLKAAHGDIKVQEGELKTASEIFEGLCQTAKSFGNVRFELKILFSFGFVLYEQNRFSDSFEVLENALVIIDQNEIDSTQELYILSFLIKKNIDFGTYNIAEQYLKRGLESASNKNRPNFKFRFLLDKINLFSQQRRFKDVQKIYLDNKQFFEENGDTYTKGVLNLSLGKIAVATKHFAEAHRLFDIAFNYFVDSENNFYKMHYYLEIGRLFSKEFQFDSASTNFERGHKLSIASNNNFFKMVYNFEMAKILILKGDLVLGRNSLFDNFDLIRKTGHETLLGHSYYLGAEVERLLGNLETALFYNEKSLQILGNSPNIANHASGLIQRGMINNELGQVDLSNQNLRDGYSMLYDTNDFVNAAAVILELILNNVGHNEIDKIENDLILIKTINSNHGSPRIDIIAKLAEATVLHTKARSRFKTKSQSLLNEIVNEPKIDYKIKIVAFVKLGELLLNEYQSNKDNEIIEEFNGIMDQLEILLKQHHSWLLKIEVLLLRSKVSVQSGNFDLSMLYIKEGKKIAIEKDLKLQLTRLENQETNLIEQIKYFENTLKSSKQTLESIEREEYDRYIKQMLQLRHRFDDLEIDID